MFARFSHPGYAILLNLSPNPLSEFSYKSKRILKMVAYDKEKPGAHIGVHLHVMGHFAVIGIGCRDAPMCAPASNTEIDLA